MLRLRRLRLRLILTRAGTLRRAVVAVANALLSALLHIGLQFFVSCARLVSCVAPGEVVPRAHRKQVVAEAAVVKDADGHALLGAFCHDVLAEPDLDVLRKLVEVTEAVQAELLGVQTADKLDGQVHVDVQHPLVVATLGSVRRHDSGVVAGRLAARRVERVVDD